MIASTFHRPEDRQRSGGDPAPWADTLPACFRSEAFAEDLDSDAAEPAPRAVVAPRQPQTPAWRLWYGLSPR